jgi:hypothetical protein
LSRKQRYSLRKIRWNYTYSVYEIAELYDLTPDTVFRWIRDDGLKRIGNFKKYLVHSSDLLKFLEKRNSKNKHPCKDGEIFCCKCKKPQRPEPKSLKTKKQPNKTIKILGKCSLCGTTMMTYVSGKKWSKTHPFHPDKNAPTKPPNGEHVSPRECQTRKGEQLCLNLTP